MNTYTAVVNLTSDPENLTFGDREVTKIRVADNTFGKDNEPRFFDVIVSSKPDMETASRLLKGDQVVVTGTLVRSSYKAKKDGNGVKKGQKVYTDGIPFGRILQVTRSPSFFEGTGNTPEAEDKGSTDAPSLDAPADDPLDV